MRNTKAFLSCAIVAAVRLLAAPAAMATGSSSSTPDARAVYGANVVHPCAVLRS